MEHVIPKWMQRKYNLGNQTNHLPNGSTIIYKHLKIPVDARHNSIFGKIEDRVASGVATPMEVYIWALKINVGILFHTSGLKVDIRSPTSDKFWDMRSYEREIQIFRGLYNVYIRIGSIFPDPFGTVVQIAALTPEPDFDFIQGNRSGTVYLQLGKRIIFVSLFDLGRLRQSSIIDDLEYKRLRLRDFERDAQQNVAIWLQRIWACEASYLMFRSFSILDFEYSTRHFHAKVPLVWPETRPGDKDEYQKFCRSFSLKIDKYDQENGHTYSSIDTDEMISLARK